MLIVKQLMQFSDASLNFSDISAPHAGKKWFNLYKQNQFSAYYYTLSFLTSWSKTVKFLISAVNRITAHRYSKQFQIFEHLSNVISDRY